MISSPARKLSALLATALLFTGAAHATTYTTLFNGTNNATLTDLGHIEISWTTAAAFGSTINATHLSDLSLSFYNSSNVLFYTDAIIVGSVVQPIGGVSRNIANIEFDATTGVSINSSFDNDLSQLQLNSASGTTYNVYGQAGTLFNIAFYIDGALQEDAEFSGLSQSTSAIPEPASFAAMAGLLAMGATLAGRRRRA